MPIIIVITVLLTHKHSIYPSSFIAVDHNAQASTPHTPAINKNIDTSLVVANEFCSSSGPWLVALVEDDGHDPALVVDLDQVVDGLGVVSVAGTSAAGGDVGVEVEL